MAELRIGGLNIHLGNGIERAAERVRTEVALPIFLAVTEKWLRLAENLLPPDHAALVAVASLAEDLRTKISKR